MVQCLATGTGGLDENGEVFASGLLADEFGKRLGPEARLSRVFLPTDGGNGSGVLGMLGRPLPRPPPARGGGGLLAGRLIRLFFERGL